MSVARGDLEAAVFNLSKGMDKADFYDIIFSTLSTNDLLTILNKLTKNVVRCNDTKACEKAVMEECVEPTPCTEPQAISQEFAGCKEPVKEEEEETVDVKQFIKRGGLDKIQEVQEKAKKYKNINFYELVNDMRMTDEDFQAVELLITRLRNL